GAERFLARLVITPRRDAAGTPIGFLLMSKDISDEIRLTEELKRKNEELEEQYRHVQEANRLKSEFLANMSHELRTPLNSVIGFSELLREEARATLSERHAGFLGDVQASGKHLLALINDILDLSKIEAGHMKLSIETLTPANCLQEATELVRHAARKKRIELAVEANARQMVRADGGKLRQVLLNLLSNAIKFSPEGSTVRVTCEDGDGEIVFAVADQG